MSVLDVGRLKALLGSDAWRWWRDRVRRELEARRPIPASISLANPSAAQREAANRLLATPGATGPIRLRTDQLALILREAGIADDLVSALIALDGELVDRVAARESETAEWKQVRETLDEAVGRFSLAADREAVLKSGLLRRLSANQAKDATGLVTRARRVFVQLGEARGPVQLAVLAAVALGDAHALDRDRVVGRLVLRLKGLSADEGVLSWRAAWAKLGVLADAVSASTLTLNLLADPKTRLGRVTETMRGEPVRLTARQLELEPISFKVGGMPVFVCENPTVLAAAASHLGEACPPMVCIDGRPTTPSLLLLSLLERDGARIRYQGDADWPGLAIQADLRRIVKIDSWKLTARDLASFRDRPGCPLDGTAVPTPWDPELASVLQERGSALHEEAILDVLLDGLTAAAHKPT